MIDERGEFSSALSARATPNVYVLQRANDDAEHNAVLVDLYLPYSRGMAPLFKLRNDSDPNPFAHFQGYQGSEVCITCHQEEGASWRITHHSKAYDTLRKIDRVKDQKCVQCHVVGLGEETGFTLGDHRSPLKDVGCEACHSASGPHDGQKINATESCVGCHDAEHSIHFSVAKGMPHIDHYVANALTKTEYKKRRKSLHDGTAERPMLAFTSGETVGAKVCLECHSDVHPNDPHKSAIKTLKSSERKS